MSDRETTIKRLRFRAWRRGFREHDFIMGAFADQHAAALDDAGLEEFQRLLDLPDWDVYYWLIGQRPVPPEHDGPVFRLIQSFQHFARSLWAREAQGG